METKERINNLKTTTMGIIVLIVGVVIIFLGKTDTWGFIALMLLAYVLIMAKDTLIEGITMGWFKLSEKKDDGTDG